MERKVFRSRVSVVLIILIAACFLPVLILMIRSGKVSSPGFYIIIGILLFVGFIYGGIRYVVTDTQLLFKMWGIQKWSIPLTYIKSIKRSYNLLSLPAHLLFPSAASVKNLIVRFKRGTTDWPYYVISPVRENEFLEILKEINPNIDIRVNDKKAWYRIWDWDI